MKTARTGKAKNQGFTLMELMVILVVAAILATVGVPFWRSLMSSQHIKTATFDVMSMLIYTRSEAMKRNSDVTLNGIGTASGYTVTTVVSGTTTKLRQSDPVTGIQVSCVNTSTSPHSYMAQCPAAGLTYNSYGRLTGTYPPIELHAQVIGTTADTTSANSRCITLTLTGQPYITKGPC